MIRLKLTKKKKIIAVFALLFVAGLASYLLTRDKGISNEAAQPGKRYYSQLTGLEVDKKTAEKPVLGVMIENSEEARPQSGLDSAGIVFETVTEAGITRYAALFQEGLPEEIGPIRSVRPAFVDWMMGFEASITHVGGSERALEMIQQRSTARDMNEFFHSESFYRRADREAPHDAFAKTTALVALQNQLSHKMSKFNEIPRSNEAPNQQPTAKLISLQFSHPIFGAQFTYDLATNSYLRSLAGAPHLDAISNKQITVKNLIVIKADIQESGLGSGAATLYKDGVAHDIRWEQKSFSSRIKLIDSTGAEVALNRGDSWFCVVPNSGSVTVQ